MTKKWLVALAICLLLGGTVVRPVFGADEHNPDQLFVEGKMLLREARYPEACAKFSESFRLDPATGTLLALALCQERSGKLASACTSYREAAQRAHSEKNAERELAAKQRVQELEPRLSKLTILVPQDARITQLTVSRNGVTLGIETWGSPVALDGGSYVIEANAPGHASFRIEVTLARDGDARAVTIPLLAPDGVSLPKRAEVPAQPREVPTPPNDPRVPLPRILSYVTGGTAVLAFGLGTFFGLQAKARNDESNSDGHCTSQGCDQHGFDLRNQAISSARVSTVSFAVGAALSIASVSLYLSSEPAKQRARVGTRFNTDPTTSSVHVTVFGEL